MLRANVPTALCWGPDLVILYNDAWHDLVGDFAADGFGYPLRSAAGDEWTTRAHAVLTGQVAATLRGHKVSRVHDGRRGEAWFDLSFSAIPLRDGSAGGVLILATTADDRIMAERRLQDAERRLTAELQHRVRNLLSVLRSVFSRTAETSGDRDELVNHFTGRLDAVARTQVAATADLAGVIDLEGLIRDELLSIAAAGDEDIVIAGPDIALSFKEAESLGLAMHELLMNAIKYGALRTAGAKLTITWSATTDDGSGCRLDLVWQEQGVPAVPVTTGKQGFGSELIRHALPYRLGGEASLDMLGGGVRCTISIPLSQVQKASVRKGEVDV